jgi:hypothetical protein
VETPTGDGWCASEDGSVRPRRISSMSGVARTSSPSGAAFLCRPFARRFSAKAVSALWLCSWAAFGQYKAEPAGAPPAEAAASIAQALEKTGFRITHNGSPYCEIWLRSRLPAGASSSAQNVTLPGIPIGAVLGLIRFDGNGSDRRGQTIQPGLYTLRYANLPANSDHQGAAPQRDFLLLIPAGDDRDPDSTPKFDTLVALSRKASGTPHPAVLSAWKADGDATVFSQQGDDWVLQTKLGGTPIAVILIGSS